MQITEFSVHISQSVKEIPAAWRIGSINTWKRKILRHRE